MQQIRQTTLRRQFRLANLVLLVGMFASGEFVLERLSEMVLRALATSPDFGTQAWSQRSGIAFRSMTLGELTVAITGIVGICGFALIEWRRGRALRSHEIRCAHVRVHAHVSRLSVRERLNVLFARGGAWAAVLIAQYGAVQLYARSLGGDRLMTTGVSSEDRLAVFAMLVALACLVGLLVAAMSMVGLRFIRELRELAEWTRSYVRHTMIAVRVALGQRIRTVRERFGDTLLSRPPPVAAV